MPYGNRNRSAEAFPPYDSAWKTGSTFFDRCAKVHDPSGERAGLSLERNLQIAASWEANATMAAWRERDRDPDPGDRLVLHLPRSRRDMAPEPQGCGQPHRL